MAFQLRGDRFNIDLPSDDENTEDNIPQVAANNPAAPFVKDVTERIQSKPPVAPTAKATSTGFPSHKKRTGASVFKQQRNVTAKKSGSDSPHATYDVPSVSKDEAQQDVSQNRMPDREDIDKENKDKLSKMTDAEIASEREELVNSLSPSLIQRLLHRANIDEPQETEFPGLSASEDQQSLKTNHQSPIREAEAQSSEPSLREDKEGETLHSSSTTSDQQHPSAPAIHFPRPPEPPELDPTSPNFLEDLHEKYFPDLSHDPSKLAWMDSTSTSTAQSNVYAAAHSSLPISALRFSFTGALLPPSVSNSIPISKGLHHHGDSPESAGYTIAELAHLARSSFPSQRCFAFQTLGRILYRLGIGEFGKLERGFTNGRIVEGEDEDESQLKPNNDQSMQDLAKGLWDCIRQGRVLETLEAEANRVGGHVSANAYATEALWLWRKGGGTEVRAT